MQPTVLGWQPIVKSWISKLPAFVGSTVRMHLLNLFTKHVPACLSAIRTQCDLVVELVDSNLVSNLCDLFSALLGSNPNSLQSCSVSQINFLLFA